MYIEPNTIIRVLHNCPLDKTYDHTIYFGSENAQVSYFQGLTKYTFSEQTYQRVQRGKARLQRKAEDLYDCNYMMFQNSSFGNKWFYAFITGVEYVNNITSEITFEIDVMQTWFFDYTLEQCFVEREHSVTDNVGDNLVPEKLELGEYVSDDFDGTQKLAEKSIVVAATFDRNYDDVGGGYYSGLFSGLSFTTFDNNVNGAAQCEEFILGAGSKSDGIVSVFLMPKAMVTSVTEPAKGYTITKSKNVSSIGGYTPKNKKLLTYPYNFLYVTNLQGNGTAYPYEYFSGSACSFTLTGDMSCNPACVLAPNDYKGVPVNYDEKMVLSGFPQLGYTTDTFKAWIAQNASSLAVNALSTAMNYAMAGGAVAGGAGVSVGATAGLVTSVANTLSQVYQAAVRPNQAHGGGGSQTMAAIGLIDFAFMHKHIRPEFARIIDDYFNVYGYATHRVKTPNRSSRPYWNYVKTIGCVVTGSIPADDMYKICDIYNRGITFWKNGANVGNYSLENRP